MSLTRPHSWLAALLAAVSLTATAQAQDFANQYRELPATSPEFHNRLNPFIEFDEFDPDLQFFAPAEVTDFGGGEPPNTGFYVTYDRMYINASRPEGDPSFDDVGDGDFGWGNRWDVGYMTADHVGWGASIWHLNGPNELLSVWQERLGRFNEDDFPLGSGEEPVLNNRNDGSQLARVYLVADSLNVIKVTNFELNRTWRRKQFHNGAVLEPFIGLRYMLIRDFGRADNYHRYDEDAVGNPIIGPEIFEGPWEQYQTHRNVFENSMLGGQLGLRLFKQSGHWLLSGEFRAIALQNWQFLARHRDTTLTRVDDFNTGGLPEIIIEERFLQSTDFSEFVWGGEIRGEAAYELTRDISLRFGFFMMNLGQGIGRSNVIRPFPFADTALVAKNEQDLFLGGLTFGFTVNR
ncbi:MAG TPA: hypothetical protein VMP01_06305 [Pirellulaceae bacterium]|nr:hypothetical protein [Pirellulaceae bacterium]